MLSWIAMILTILGQIAISKQKVAGFYMWLCSNSIWMYLNEDLAFRIAFVVVQIFCVYGIINWRKLKVVK